MGEGRPPAAGRRASRVLFEIDDYARSVRKKRDHAIGHQFGADFIKQFEMCMRVCDGVICSTDYLARRYRSINPRTWVCQNAIDLPRYRFTRGPRRRPDASAGPAGPGTARRWSRGCPRSRP